MMRIRYPRQWGGLLAGLLTLLAAPAQAQTIQSFPAVADAYVQGGTGKDNNFSSEARIAVKKGSTANVLRYGYLKFDTKPLTLSKVGTATLKIFCYKQEKTTTQTEITAYTTTDNWDEATLTFANAPALGVSAGSGTVQVGSYLAIDVTDYVKSQLATKSLVSFGLGDALTSNSQNEFYSKEAAANPPLLELSDQATVTTTLTSTYYVDAAGGSDTNLGLSATTAWQTLDQVSKQTYGPGARILFKAGQRFAGVLAPNGSGSAGKPIVVDQYGTGDRPALDGNGAAYTLRLDNQQYWEVNNLEITNYNAAEEGGLTLAQWEANNVSQWANVVQPPQYAVTRTKKFGLLVSAQDIGAVKHLHFVNINMHGINGFIDNDRDDSKFNGGMFFDIGGTTVPTYFDDLLIEKCRIADVDRTGVSNRSSWTNRTLTTSVNWTPTLNYVIRGNTFERTGANALIVRDSKNPLIERNLFDHCAIKTSGNAGFNFDTDGALWQFNESRFTKANVKDTDAGGLDSDYKSKGTIMQYNYLHDNDYGLLITGGPGAFNDSTILRYNILERNGLQPQNASDGKYQLKVSGTATRTIIHNNVFYTDSTRTDTKPVLHKQWTDWPDQTSYYNNVFYLLGPSPSFDLGGSTNNLFSNNLYYGSPINNKPVDPYAVNANPDMVAPGTGPTGYKLQTGSAAIAKGKLIPTTPAFDYFQGPINQANAIDIGAQQFSNVPPPVAPPALLTQQLFGLEDAYVEGGASANTNFGSAAILRVKNNPASADATRQTYIKYDLNGITNPSNVVSVRLVVNTTVNPTGTLPISVFAVNDDTWRENTITDANQPGRNDYVSTLLATSTATSNKQSSVDITNYALSQLKGDKMLSLTLLDTTASNVLANIVSKEGGALQHYLLITTRGSIAPPPVAKAKFDLYLLIGQSNMAGRGEIGAADKDSLQNVLLFNGSGWEQATNPLNKYSTVRQSLAVQQLGPGYSFGRKLAALTGQTIGLVVNARGSTSISQWQKGYSGANDVDLYEQAVAQLRKVQGQGNFKGILWHQGESDQSNAGAYLAKFQQLVADLRQDLGANVPVVAGELGKWRSSSTDLNAVIRSIPANVAKGYYVSSDDLTPLNGDLTEPHFDGPSQRVLGERYAEKIASVVYSLELAATPAAAAAQVLAYPSPTHGLLTIIRPAGTAPTTAMLLNTLGQTVRTLPLPTTETAVDLTGLAPGVYTMRLLLDGQPLTRRIVLQ